MPSLPPPLFAKATAYLRLGWQVDAIVKEIHCHPATIYRLRRSLSIRGTPYAPRIQTLGAPKKLTKTDEDCLLRFLDRYPSSNQEEMAWFFWEERGKQVNQSTVSRVLKRRKWSKKKAERVPLARAPDLRRGYLSEMSGILAEEMVFLDESMFNQTTGWRGTAWAPIGQPARYIGDRTRGHAWSFLAGYTTEGYLPCYSIREGYFNADSFHDWIVDDLLPCCNAYPGRNSVIIMDNAQQHCDPRIADAIREKGCLVRYLPPYSPDFNPIELSFSVLKSWVRRRFHDLWPTFDGSFGNWLKTAIEQSRCDRFAAAHFRHSGNGGYVFAGDMEKLDQELRAFEQGLAELQFTAET